MVAGSHQHLNRSDLPQSVNRRNHEFSPAQETLLPAPCLVLRRPSGGGFIQVIDVEEIVADDEKDLLRAATGGFAQEIFQRGPEHFLSNVGVIGAAGLWFPRVFA